MHQQVPVPALGHVRKWNNCVGDLSLTGKTECNNLFTCDLVENATHITSDKPRSIKIETRLTETEPERKQKRYQQI